MLYILGVLLVIFLSGLPYKIDIRKDEIESEKIHRPVKVCVLSDLHCRPFGKGQSRIKKIIDEENPDFVVISGDLFDTGRNYDVSFDLIRALQNRTVYFTSGNHDNYLPEMDEFRDRMRKMGVHVLEDQGERFNEDIVIAGLCDSGRTPVLSVEEVNELAEKEGFRILISHRPNHIDLYSKIDYPLIICGHVHGGQWRIPFIWKGIIGPQQGFFPKYADGIHNLNGNLMYISRGLASADGRIPRLYNNPEIGFILLKPKEENKQ
ncbi:MAG: metallophosphoesterase [Erysipelotrichaceae bacterium]|nr:metallophosphoesterase [Erysipelotrichaceae bacterium]